MCDECASGFGNRTLGYCRKCCGEKEDPHLTRCEDCAHYPPDVKKETEHYFSLSILFKIFLIAIILTGGVIFCIFKITGSEFNNSIRNRSSNYTQLPIISSSKLLISEDDSESEEESDVTLRV